MVISRQKSYKIKIIFGLIVLFALALVFYLYTSRTTSVSKVPPAVADKSTESASSTSQLPSAQPDFSGDDNKDPGNTVFEEQGSAKITDTMGQKNPTMNNPVTSGSGEITVYEPQNNSLLQQDQELYGTSTLASVHYRIIDSVRGVISTGELKVVDGRFSGKVTFDTSAQNGRLDIFGVKDDATEFSNIEILVRFK